MHSPFAYDIVKRVLYPGRRYAWYGYEMIEETIETGNHIPNIRKDARRLLRLASFLNIRSAFLPDGSHPALRIALQAADSHVTVLSDPAKVSECRLILSSARHIPLEKLCSGLTGDNNIVLISNTPEGWKEKMFEALPQGLMMYDSKSTLIINRPGMNKIAYSIKL